MRAEPRESREAPAPADEQIVRRVCEGDTEAFEILLRRYKQAVYWTALSVLRDDAEAEEIAQEVWVRAFGHLDQFSGRGAFVTWIRRIALREAWASARRRRKGAGLSTTTAEEMPSAQMRSDPEGEALDREIRGLIELAIDALPEKYRLVFVTREIEGLSTAEAAHSLRLSQITIKTRLHRARLLLRDELLARGGPGIRTCRGSRASWPIRGLRTDSRPSRSRPDRGYLCDTNGRRPPR